MATKDQIKKAILDVAGNPDSGAIKELVDAWADAIVDLDSPTPSKPEASEGIKDAAADSGMVSDGSAKEVRVLKADETR
ncbi:MAG: hypothetical protein EBS38_07570 [Actinobacteria bacterium]|nr:hypothetical protein [Actinomycetota bacterium]